MIDRGELRLPADGPDRIVVDGDGTVRPAAGYEEVAVPALVVGEATEALKEVEAGQVVGSIDRDTAWEVRGLVLGRDILARIPEHVDSVGALIAAVSAAGIDWEIVPTNPL